MDNSGFNAVFSSGGGGSSSSGVQSVTGLNTDNTDPQNPIIEISVDGTTITGDGTSANPIVANNNPRTLASVNGLNLTGTAYQISASVLIPSGTIVTNNSIYIRNLLTKTTGSTSSNARIYINTSNSLTGATQLAFSQTMNSTNFIQRFERNYFFDGTNLFAYAPTGTGATDLITGTITLVPFNPNIDNYLLFAVANSTTTPDNLGQKRVIVQIYD